MSKRKNPFGVTAPVQLKVHVGAKRAATQEDLEEVYRRTRERLLGSGKKKLSNGSGTVNGGQGGAESDAVVCRCCNTHIKKTPSIMCGNCHFKLCSTSCLRECCTCGQSFCQLCTVLNHDTPQVRAFCFNCLSSFSFQSS